MKNLSIGLFNVKGAYRALLNTNDHVDAFFYDFLWILVCPSNVKAFIWRLSKDKFPFGR